MFVASPLQIVVQAKCWIRRLEPARSSIIGPSQQNPIAALVDLAKPSFSWPFAIIRSLT
jgi:hypothetical protein